MAPLLLYWTAFLGFLGTTFAISVKDIPGRNSIARVIGDDAFDDRIAVDVVNNFTLPVVGNSTFEQLIDHERLWLGSFSQFYFYSDQYYTDPGSPVRLHRLDPTPRASSLVLPFGARYLRCGGAFWNVSSLICADSGRSRSFSSLLAKSMPLDTPPILAQSD